MRIALPLLALAFSTASAAGPTPFGSTETPFGSTDERQAQPGSPERVCRDRIQTVREERGLPKLDRGNASKEEPLFIAAVDKRIDGCSVMVMRNDTSDIRPLPAPPIAPPRVQRIPGQ